MMDRITRPQPWLTNTKFNNYEVGILVGWETLVGDLLDAIGKEMATLEFELDD